jgi:fused signal recognition particle receptor
MFKNLRDRLGGFKGKLKDKVEEELETAPEKALIEEESSPEPVQETTHPEPVAEPTPPQSVDRRSRREVRAHKRASRKKDTKKRRDKVLKKEKPKKATSQEGPAAFTDSIMGKMIKERKLDDLLDDLETILLESDVALPVAEAIKEKLKEELLGKRLKRDVDLDDFVEAALMASIKGVLAVEPVDLDVYVEARVKAREIPVVLMFVGVNGTGKTTTIARIAHRYKKRGLSSVLAAGDTFRAGAIEQLEIHANRLGVKIIKHKAGSDPAAVAFDAVEHAKARYKDLVLIDTAGRMQTNINLMDEMKKIKRISKPDLVIFVGDSLAGNDAVEQARRFDEAVGIDIAVLTKIDADAKGGAALSIAHAVGRPIAFVGTGQEYEDLDVFDPDWMVNRLFA